MSVGLRLYAQLKDAAKTQGPGEHLRAELKRLGLDQVEAGEILDVSRQSINNIINGRQTISRPMARKLGAITGRVDDYWLRSSFPPSKEPVKLVVKPAKKKMKREPFRDFVLKQSGDLVDEIKADRKLLAVKTWAQLRFRLIPLGDEKLVAARALWQRYRKILEK